MSGTTQHVDGQVPYRAWATAVGVFWLTRLLRDREVHVRSAAARLLAILVHPAAGQMRSVLLRAWPEGGTVMMRHGLSRRQPPAFAAAALTFTAASMATSSVDVPKAGHDQSTSVRHLAQRPKCGADVTLAHHCRTWINRSSCLLGAHWLHLSQIWRSHVVHPASGEQSQVMENGLERVVTADTAGTGAVGHDRVGFGLWV